MTATTTGYASANSLGQWASNCGPGSVASTPAGSLFKTHILGPHPRPADQKLETEARDLCVNKTPVPAPPTPRGLCCLFRLQTQCSKEKTQVMK